MVDTTQTNYAKIFQNRMGVMHSVLEFMETKQVFDMQQTNKRCYNSIVP